MRWATARVKCGCGRASCSACTTRLKKWLPTWSPRLKNRTACARRELLRERALAQVDVVCGEPEADKLFKFWGSSSAAYHDRVLTQLTDARSEAQMAQAVAPLLGLSAKVTRFSESVTRLEKLGLPYESPYEPGAVIAQTLARGLGENHADWIAFAEQHLAAYEKLVAALKRQNVPPHAVRKELADRVNMSQGAAQFLVQILDERSPLYPIVTRRVGLTPRYLTDEFSRGLASTDATTYDRGVGRVHIVDMLSDTLRKWPAAPKTGSCSGWSPARRRPRPTATSPKRWRSWMPWMPAASCPTIGLRSMPVGANSWPSGCMRRPRLRPTTASTIPLAGFTTR